ncbi:hypothetical protein SAMN04488556_1742 [Halostagnicola kamekurae]|uniref:Uncharacterized protein n=1 Tax=Halostagnicola kamekurae TaxID=619731 RepID=A0A1I6REL2_9EURY|nr:hypothetical protein SAMN04488556_1742 [Halostagnicola kamekurae]
MSEAEKMFWMTRYEERQRRREELDNQLQM